MKNIFKIQHNLIITASRISAVYKLEPIDLIILPEVEQEVFMQDMQHMLASLQEGTIQIIMRTRKAIPNDFANHFSNLRDVSAHEHQELITQYIEQLSDLLSRNIIPVKEYYMIFQQNYQRQGPDQIYLAVQQLERNIARIAGNIVKAGIGIKQLEGQDLNYLLASFTRPY